MEALLMIGVVLATIAVGAFCKDRYDNPEQTDPHRRSKSLHIGRTHRSGNSHNRHNSIDGYHRHTLNHTQKLR